MFTWGEIDHLERQLKASIVALKKKDTSEVTLVEAVDDAALWPEAFNRLAPIAPRTTVENLTARAPLLVCAVASEIGFRFEGVGTVFWARLTHALGLPISAAERVKIGETFSELATRYKLSRPSESAFSSHFSIISWPIANALLPFDTGGRGYEIDGACAGYSPSGIGPLNQSREPPCLGERSRGKATYRLAAPWRAFDARAHRASDGKPRGRISQTTYTRLRDAIAAEPEALSAVRSARLRARTAKASPISAEQTVGRLALTHDATGARMFVSWPALPPGLFDDARPRGRPLGAHVYGELAASFITTLR